MAKIIKSLFNTSERRKSRYEEKDDENNVPQDFRRKLSISRSGRMRQANKKRQSLSLDVYGQEQVIDKSRISDPLPYKGDQGKSELKSDILTKRRHSGDILTPEQEIDNAFEIIDKT